MDIRDLLFTAMMATLMPVSFRRPLIGLLAFSWLAYMRTQDLTWGFARGLRWSLLIAGVTLAGYLFSSKRAKVVWTPVSYALLGLVIQVGLSVVLAEGDGGSAANRYQSMVGRYIEFAKIIGVALFTTAVVRRVEHLRILVWIVGLSFAFYGVKIGLAGVLTGGGLFVKQGPGGMMEDNNDFALALCMGLPLLIQIGNAERNPVLRRGVFFTVPFTVLTVLMTRSRGGFLSLSAMIGLLIWRSRNRVAAMGLAAAGVLVALPMLPQSFYDRIATIATYHSDGSAQGRLAAWRTAIRMASDNPIFGVGLYRFQEEYRTYAATPDETARATHNAYLQIWAECGTPALLMYLFLLVGSFWSLWRLRARAKRLYSTSWILSYATMFEATMLTFMVGSTFLSRAHFDLFYHLVAMVVAFEAIATREMDSLYERGPSLMRGASFYVDSPRGFQRPPPRRGFRDGLAPRAT
ncbi:MAG TPA: putative O-glycosylation ligase, exosortase A system-associated [Planctomycetota bacterium]|nr:putative O-glycosylation ligase, exosortase A system-associated [Planctomycetota bacterium]